VPKRFVDANLLSIQKRGKSMARKILIIDDDPTTIALTQFLLKTNEYVPIAAFDGVEGLKKVEVEQPELIVLDIKMPKMDGYTFLQEVRKIKHAKKTPVIMLTSQGNMEELFKMEGVYDYMVKPLDTEAFLKKIEKCLS